MSQKHLPTLFINQPQMVSFFLIFTSKIGEMIHFDLSAFFKKSCSTTTSNPPFSREKRHVAGDTATAILLPKVVDAVRGKMSPLTGKPVQVVSQMNDTIQ